jgi:hypothetical protein
VGPVVLKPVLPVLELGAVSVMVPVQSVAIV